MTPHYIIDGYNFIHQIPKFSNAMGQSLEQARNLLISFMKTYLSAKHIQITLVFDGEKIGVAQAIDWSTNRLKIVFSHSPEKADPVIKQLIGKAKNKKAVILVSADHDLINSCKIEGAHVLSPQTFFHQLSKSMASDQLQQKYDQEISEPELKEWMTIFGVTK